MLIRASALVDGGVQFQAPEFYEDANEIIQINTATFFKFTGSTRAAVDAELGFVQHPGRPFIQSMGVSNRLITAGAVSGKVERVADPDDASKWAWLQQINIADPDTSNAGAKRSEFSFAGNILPNVVYTLGFEARVNDYRTATDEFLICQIHQATGGGTPPFLIYFFKGVLRVAITRPDGSLVVVWSTASWTPAVWMTFVVRLMFDALNGFCQVWFNGAQVGNYSGPTGTAVIPGSYLKGGPYQWGDAGNVWDTNFPTKLGYFKGPYLDAADNVAGMRAFLATI